jgi:hypothetical protein
MTERTYTIGELKQLISESTNEFKPKVGDGVESKNKKANSATYSDAKKRAKDYDGGGDEEKKKVNLQPKEDGNKLTTDVRFDYDPGKQYTERVKKQVEGYTSPLEAKNKEEKAADFSTNEKLYKQFKDAGEKMAKNVETGKKMGLTARQCPDETFKKHGVYESKKIAVLNFKNTTFLNESQMISRIPDDYKVDGKRFKVKDAGENEFIVEWAEGEANILSYENKKKLNESIAKFQKLSGYSSKTQFKNSTSQSRLNESTEFGKILDKARIMAETK